MGHQPDPERKEALAALERAGLPEPAPEVSVPGLARRGRGATLNPAVRFDQQSASAFDDGWDTLETEEPAPLPTTLTRDATRSVISWNESPDLGCDRAVNPYRGCEHGCVYCYARPTHAYLGYSPGLDFETKLIFKPEVAELLEKELKKPGYVAQTMVLGSNTDPYQPVERTLKLTRAVLEVLDRYNHPVSIVTKSAGVLRDVDILGSMARRKLARVYVSLTTLDPVLARKMEPRAAAPMRRLQTMAELTRAGVPVGVMTAPMIPGLNDSELEKLIEAAARSGARHAMYSLLRLPHELRKMFEDWLDTHYPERAKHVLSLIRDTRGGGLNDSSFHQRFSGAGVYADLLRRRFERAVRQWGVEQNRAELDASAFAIPGSGRGFAEKQLSLF
jgi:DNA repair photolyase